MKCPFCKSSEIKVIDSRSSEDELAIKRRRECLSCKNRFTTYERFEGENILVLKRSGALEPFECTKIRNGIIRALEKRPVSVTDVNNSVEKIETRILLCEKSVIESKMIGEYILEELKSIDLVAYIRFASVYNDFNNVGEFIKIVEKVSEAKNG